MALRFPHLKRALEDARDWVVVYVKEPNKYQRFVSWHETHRFESNVILASGGLFFCYVLSSLKDSSNSKMFEDQKDMTKAMKVEMIVKFEAQKGLNEYVEKEVVATRFTLDDFIIETRNRIFASGASQAARAVVSSTSEMAKQQPPTEELYGERGFQYANKEGNNNWSNQVSNPWALGTQVQ